VQWRWWWESSGDSLAQYAQGESTSMVKQEVISSNNGSARWEFEVKYPEWGRYLVRACDLDGGHCTGKVFYIDWPSWAGAAAIRTCSQYPHAELRQAGVSRGRNRGGSPAEARRAARCSRWCGSAILEQR
jgi:hypothetical protein